MHIFQAQRLEIRGEAKRRVAVAQPNTLWNMHGNPCGECAFKFDRFAVSEQKAQAGVDYIRRGLQCRFCSWPLGNTTQDVQHVHHCFSTARARLEVYGEFRHNVSLVCLE